MFRKILIFLFIIPAIATAQLSSFGGAPKYAPADGKKLLIMGQDLESVGGLEGYDDGYMDHIAGIPAGFTTYTGFPDLGGLKTKGNWGAGDVHADAYINDNTFDNSAIVIGLYLVDQLKNIIGGQSDNIIEELGNWIKNQPRPVFLRIGYEFEGSWNHYNAADYKAAWKYIVHYFDDLDVRNVSYVWQSAGINASNIANWYPGDEYVNWVGYSHFDGPNPGQSMRNFAEAHDKPIMIAEATPKVDLKSGSGITHWNNWYDPLFKTIRSNQRIKALAYINCNWDAQDMWRGQGWGDSRVQINSDVKTNWENEIANEQWLLAGEDLFDLLKFNQWLDSTYVSSAEEPIKDKLSMLIGNDTKK